MKTDIIADALKQRGWDEAIGLDVTTEPGEFTRFGHKGRCSAWVRTSPMGYHIFGFEDWSDPDRKLFISTESDQMDPGAVKKFNDEFVKKVNAQILERNESAKKRAQALWDKARDVIDHGYLTKKGVAGFGVKLLRDKLLIPMRDINGELWSVQRIFETEGKYEKRFLKNGRCTGLYHTIGEINDETKTIRIAEGYATAASIHEATGDPTICTFSASNLITVARELRDSGKYKERKFVICGDNDESGTGQRCGEDAAKELGCISVFPSKTGEDFNDVANRGGAAEVLNELYKIPDKFKRWYSIGELRIRIVEPRVFIVDDLIAEGSSALLAGNPKAGKSTLLQQMCLDIVMGIPFLGRSTIPANILYASAEQEGQDILDHFSAMGYSEEAEKAYLRVTGKDTDNYSGKLICLDDILEYIRFLRDSNRGTPKIVIMDTLAKVLKMEDLNDYGKVNKALRPLTEAANELKFTYIVTHHSNKTPPQNGNKMSSVLGSTAITGDVAINMLLMGSGGDSREFNTEGRYGKHFHEAVLDYDPITKLMAFAGTKRDIKELEKFAEVRDLLGNETMAQKMLMGDMAGRNDTKNAIINKMIKQGMLIATKTKGTANGRDLKVNPSYAWSKDFGGPIMEDDAY